MGSAEVKTCLLAKEYVGLGFELLLTVAESSGEDVGLDDGKIFDVGLRVADEFGVLTKVADGVRMTSVNKKRKTSKTKMLDA